MRAAPAYATHLHSPSAGLFDSADASPSTMPHVLDNMVVFDPEGRRVRLDNFGPTGSRYLVFVRHFGCLFAGSRCRYQSPGRPCEGDGGGSHCDRPRQRRRGPCLPRRGEVGIPLLTDPTRQSYGALGMRRGLASILTLRPWSARSTPGDPASVSLALPAIRSNRAALW